MAVTKQGTHKFLVRAKDSSNLWGPAKSVMVRVDTGPPGSSAFSTPNHTGHDYWVHSEGSSSANNVREFGVFNTPVAPTYTNTLPESSSRPQTDFQDVDETDNTANVPGQTDLASNLGHTTPWTAFSGSIQVRLAVKDSNNDTTIGSGLTADCSGLDWQENGISISQWQNGSTSSSDKGPLAVRWMDADGVQSSPTAWVYSNDSDDAVSIGWENLDWSDWRSTPRDEFKNINITFSGAGMTGSGLPGKYIYFQVACRDYAGNWGFSHYKQGTTGGANGNLIPTSSSSNFWTAFDHSGLSADDPNSYLIRIDTSNSEAFGTPKFRQATSVYKSGQTIASSYGTMAVGSGSYGFPSYIKNDNSTQADSLANATVVWQNVVGYAGNDSNNVTFSIETVDNQSGVKKVFLETYDSSQQRISGLEQATSDLNIAGGTPHRSDWSIAPNVIADSDWMTARNNKGDATSNAYTSQTVRFLNKDQANNVYANEPLINLFVDRLRPELVSQFPVHDDILGSPGSGIASGRFTPWVKVRDTNSGINAFNSGYSAHGIVAKWVYLKRDTGSPGASGTAGAWDRLGQWVNQAGTVIQDAFTGTSGTFNNVDSWHINVDPDLSNVSSATPFNWDTGAFDNDGFFANLGTAGGVEAFRSSVSSGWSDCYIIGGNAPTVTSANNHNTSANGQEYIVSGSEFSITPTAGNAWGLNEASLSSVYLTVGNAATWTSSWAKGDILYTTDHTWPIPAVAFYVEDNAGNPMISVLRFGVNINEPHVRLDAYTDNTKAVHIDDHTASGTSTVHWINDDDPYFEWSVDVPANGVTHYSILMVEPEDVVSGIVADKEEDYTSATSSWDLTVCGVPDTGSSPPTNDNVVNTSSFGHVADDTSSFPG